MGKIDVKDQWVLVTGASSGLGREMALLLARREKANLIIVARRKGKLEQLKEEIETSCRSRVEVIETDLSDLRNVDLLVDRAVRIGNIYALINNAGLTDYGKSDPKKLDIYEKIINVNFMAAMKLSLLFISHFQKQSRGVIFNVSSQGAFVPIPYQNIYAASKCALQSFSDALREEYRSSGIVISSFAPGGIYSEMVSRSGIADQVSPSRFFMMGSRQAAIKAVRALKRGKALEIPTLVYKLNHLFTHLLPRRWLVAAAARIYRPGKDFKDGGRRE